MPTTSGQIQPAQTEQASGCGGVAVSIQAPPPNKLPPPPPPPPPPPKLLRAPPPPAPPPRNSSQLLNTTAGILSDNGSCNLGVYNQDARGFIQTPCNGCCVAPTSSPASAHLHGSAARCQNQNNAPNMVRINNGADNGNQNQLNSTTISRNALFYNHIDNTLMACGANGGAGSCSSEPVARAQCVPPYQHHHNMHTIQLSSSSSLSSLQQPVDQNQPGSFNRCNMSQSSAIPSMSVNNQLQQRLQAQPNNCNHVHRIDTACNHNHYQTNFCNHRQIQAVASQQANHECGTTTILRHNCNSSPMTSKTCPADVSHHNHYLPDLTANRSSDTPNNDPQLSTAHAHNLSNSSTTTHTSNVAVKHQPQFHQLLSSRGGQSSVLQQYEQYGISSAASTSSATASLSSYHTPAGFEDLSALYPSSKIRQPLPPPPNIKSRPVTPSCQVFSNNGTISNNGNGIPIMTTTFLNMLPQTQQQQQQQVFNQATVPRLPPKPVSPNASSSSTQITTVRTSPSPLNQPITRVTSQAGVQNPLPNSDVPPPLPPLCHRNQPLVNSLMTRGQNVNNSAAATPLNPIPGFNALNLYRNSGTLMETERKNEGITRQIELELEQQQQKSSNVCPKCGNKVLPAQEACEAMNQTYHVSCFVCCECNRALINESFYPVRGKIYCEKDFKYTGLEKCAACSQPISNMILTSMGKSYHPKCFKCCICGQCLDGVLFTIDIKNKIYCVKDYHSIYSPKCAACGEAISPIDETGETVRVVSMDKDYHIDCYCCEDCGLQLTDEESNQAYPLDNHLLCQRCHINRLNKMKPHLVLSQS